MNIQTKNIARILIVTQLMCSACSHNDANVATSENQKVLDAKTAKIENVLSTPQFFSDDNISVKGFAEKAFIKKVSGDITLLTLYLRNTKAIEDKKKLLTKEVITDYLSKSNILLTDTMEYDMCLNPKNKRQLRNLSLDLRSASKKTMALKHYFNALNSKEFAGSLKKIADGYEFLGKGFEILAQSIPSETNSITKNKDVAKHHIQSTLSNPKVNLRVSQNILTAGENLLMFSNQLIQNRQQIEKKKILLELKNIDLKSGYSLQTFSEMLAAKAWNYQKVENFEAEAHANYMSQAYFQLGKGLNNINSGINEVHQILIKSNKVNYDDQDESFLRCSFYGTNGSVIEDCYNKVQSIGKSGKIIVYGTVIQGNFREVLGITWMKIAAIEVDGIKMNIEYGNESSTLRGAKNLYKWAQEVK